MTEMSWAEQLEALKAGLKVTTDGTLTTVSEIYAPASEAVTDSVSYAEQAGADLVDYYTEVYAEYIPALEAYIEDYSNYTYGVTLDAAHAAEELLWGQEDYAEYLRQQAMVDANDKVKDTEDTIIYRIIEPAERDIEETEGMLGFMLDPLFGILTAISQDIGERLERFLANALGVERGE